MRSIWYFDFSKKVNPLFPSSIYTLTRTQIMATHPAHLVRCLRAKGDKVPEHVRVLEVGLGVPLLRVDETVEKKKTRRTKRNATQVELVLISN